MGILPQVATLIVREHKHRPITGDVLLIGRQTVMLSEPDAMALLRREGVPVRPGFVSEGDHQTIAGQGFISDRSFFSMFTDARVFALDVSDYEGAEIVHDLCFELPDKYAGIADFIFNGSCLDNLFDPARAMRSLSKMVRPGGRMMDIEHGTPVNGAFICYSPEWFFDFFAANNYADCQIIVGKFRKLLATWHAYWWRPYFAIGGKLRQSYPTYREDFVTVCVAEKGPNSTDDKTPVQAGYRAMQSGSDEAHYIEKYQDYLRSSRDFGFSRGLDQVFPHPLRLSPELLLGVFARFGFDVSRGNRWPIAVSRSSSYEQFNRVTAPFVGKLRGI
jgi:SAM-dependent methyltransferase